MFQSNIFKILFFFCIGALLALGLHLLISFGMRRVHTSEIGAFNRAMSGHVNAQVIISGSSRAYRDFDPRVIQAITGRTGFNLGRNGSHTDVQLATLKEYLKHNDRPDIVIHNLDMHSFEPTLPNEIFKPAEYVPYLDNTQLFKALWEIDRNVWKWKYIPLYGYVVPDLNMDWLIGLGNLVNIDPPNDTFDGFCPMNQSWNHDFELWKTKHPQGVGFETFNKGIRIVEDLIKTCQTNQVSIVLTYAPQYYEMLNLVTNRAIIFNQFQEMADRFHVPFWDYSRSKFCTNRNLFYNSQHLNARGAEVFSQDLANRILLRYPNSFRKNFNNDG